MKKIRENGLLKFVAGLFLGLGIIAGIVSGIFSAGAIVEDYYGPGGKVRVKESIIEEIAWFYNEHALDYCEEMVRSINYDDYKWDHKFYKDLFAEENTNYMFRISAVENGVAGKELLSNYYVDDVQYMGEINTSISVEDEEETISCTIQVSDIISPVSFADLPSYVREEYADGQWWFYSIPDTAGFYYEGDFVKYVDDSQPGNTSVSEEMPELTVAEADVMATAEEMPELTVAEVDVMATAEVTVTGEGLETETLVEYENQENRAIYAYSYPLRLNNVFVYENEDDVYINIDNAVEWRLIDNSEYKSEYEKLMDKTKDYDYISRFLMDYDVSSGLYTETYTCGHQQDVLLNYYVKSDLTAHDHFAMSYRLKYLTQIFDAALPVFVVSCLIVLITLIYLVWAAGHKRSVEGIYVSRLDRIPYDIVLAVYAIGVLFGLYLVMDCTYSTRSAVALSVPLGIVVMLFPAFLNTTVVRFKMGNVLKNTVVVRTFKWIWKEVKSACSYLRENVNIVWKWLVGFVALGVFELILCMVFYEEDFIIMLLIIDFLVMGAVLVIAAINMNKLKEGAKKIAAGNIGYKLDTDHMLLEFKKHGETLNSINDGISVAVNERLKSEHMQTELITNVTHDIKTPLTSIISYVDLLSKEKLNNEKAKEYVEVLTRQSERLKKLIEDLIEASKATTGNLKVELSDLDVRVLLEQSLGEFSDKLEAKGLKTVVNFKTEDTVVNADGKHLWRVFDNLINNISKYAQENSRVYIDVERIVNDEALEGMRLDEIVRNNYSDKTTEMLKVSFKNISKEELNISGEELMERFVRGDKSRNTEGNGLGLSIAKSLMKIQNGDLQIVVDGDLFKVVLILM